MAKKPSAIYEPGELEKVRGRLGPVDESEAKRIAKKLGGEIGTEKSASSQPAGKSSGRGKNQLAVPGRKSSRPFRAIETADYDDEYGVMVPAAKQERDFSDDPSVQLKTSYSERVKMDRYAAQMEFEIKNVVQALVSVLYFFGEPVDYVNPRFVSRRINFYFAKIEQLVNSTRVIFPRNDTRRSERLRKSSPYFFSILDVIRYWNIERIDEELTRIQSHPRSVRVAEFAEVIRDIYRPLFVLEKLNMDFHIKGAYKLLYKIISLEEPAESKDRNQNLIRNALASFTDIRREVHYGLYPLLMKFISDRWLPYERLFTERSSRFMAFLGLTENDQIKPQDPNLNRPEDGRSTENTPEDIEKEEGAAEPGKDDEIDSDDPKAAEKKVRAEAELIEKKAIDHSLKALESLFPKAGWEELENYPDLYPYFVNAYQLRRGYELIGPSDPLQQAAILMHIIEDLCVGLSFVDFTAAAGPDGSLIQVSELIGSMIENWRRYIDDSFSKQYLPRLTEYCRLLEHSAESRTSTFAKRTLNEIRWIKRLYFLPYFKFQSMGPPPYQKQDIVSIYSEVRNLRKGLTMVAVGIEQGNRIGGADAKAPCEGIANPWDKYNFTVSNPVSKRIDALLPPSKRNNTALIFFALSVVTVLDNLLNNENSWAYGDKVGCVFRSVKNEGAVPVFGIDNKLDADKIFRDVMKQKNAGKK